MSKPFTNASVRICPQASAPVRNVHRVDKSRRELTPPDPPLPRVGSVTDQERHRRVTEEGSRRKRDLAGYRRVKAQAEQERMAFSEATDVIEVTADLLRLLATAAPESTFKIWLEPLQPVAGDGITLYLTAPEGIATWVERRYSPLIREALQATGSGYTDVEFVSAGEGR